MGLAPGYHGSSGGGALMAFLYIPAPLEINRTYTGPCRRCGVEITSKSPARRYCAACRKVRTRETTQKANARRAAKRTQRGG